MSQYVLKVKNTAYDIKYVVILYFMGTFGYCAYNKIKLKQNGRIAYLMETRNAYKIFIRKSQEKTSWKKTREQV